MKLSSHPLVQLILARFREFYRQPEAIFWVYVFPVLLAVGLGIAFRDRPVEHIAVDLQQGKGAEAVERALQSGSRFKLHLGSAEQCRLRLRTGKTAIVVKVGPEGYAYLFDPTRPESVLARRAVDDALQRAAGRSDPVAVVDEEVTEVGSRYIDFLIPGLIGMNLMGGGLWGIGFVTVDMRLRKLLKRFLATPMRRSHFLLGLMISRILFMIPEVIVVIVFARWIFGVRIYGSIATVALLVLLGALTFCGVGLLVASRARTLEGVSGLMNLVMVPMWLLSGIFFSSDRFPDAVQPVIQALPLTPLIQSLREVYLEGASVADQTGAIAMLLVYCVVSFVLALWWFRWE